MTRVVLSLLLMNIWAIEVMEIDMGAWNTLCKSTYADVSYGNQGEVLK